MRSDSKVASCEVRFVPIGTEIRILRNDSLLYSRTFVTGDEALAWAEEERGRMVSEGWQTEPAREPPV